MKNVTKKSTTCHFTILGGALICIALLFSSCKNFLTGIETKKQIVQAIEYANAPSYKISLNSEDKTGVVKSPAGGEADKKVTDVFTVSFEPFADYEFLYWKIIDKATGTELQNGDYLLLESMENSETTCTFVNKPQDGMQLCLYPVTVERPQIISYSPLTSGIIKDMSIQILFDFEMDPASIYYTEDEMKAMITSGEAEEGAFEETLENKKIYKGYKKDGQLFFKNIIIKNNKTGQNLNAYFDAPLFENTTTLIIPRTKDAELEDFIQVLVTIEKGLSYIAQNGKSVEMAGVKKWMYQVNDEVDNSKLSFVKLVMKKNAAVPDSQSFKTSLMKNYSVENTTDLRDKTYYLENNSLYLDLRVQETKKGTGPKSTFKMNFVMVGSGKYQSIIASEPVTKEIPFTAVTVDDAIFKGTINFEELGLSDGVYQVSFEFEDRSASGNPIVYPVPDEDPDNNEIFFIGKDNTPPVSIESLNYPLHDSENECFTLSWNATNIMPKPDSFYKIDCYDPDNVCIKTFYSNATCYRYSSNRCEYDINDSEFNPDKDYHTFVITPLDRAGHQNESMIQKIYTGIMLKGFQAVEGATVSEALGNSLVFTQREQPLVIPDMWVCDHEVTQAEYTQYMSLCPGKSFDKNAGQSGDYPAYNLTWYDAIMYCNLRSEAENLEPVYYLNVKENNEMDYYNDRQRLKKVSEWVNVVGKKKDTFISTNIATITENGKTLYYFNADTQNNLLDSVKYDTTANGYRLPTEVEWEYFAREGKDYLEEDLLYAGCYNSQISTQSVAWCVENTSGTKIQEIRTKRANRLYLYDVAGNVREWCWDWYTDNPSSYTVLGPVGFIYDSRIVRGGGFKDSSGPNYEFFKLKRQRVYMRTSPEELDNGTGFRVVRTMFED